MWLFFPTHTPAFTQYIKYTHTQPLKRLSSQLHCFTVQSKYPVNRRRVTLKFLIANFLLVYLKKAGMCRKRVYQSLMLARGKQHVILQTYASKIEY